MRAKIELTSNTGSLTMIATMSKNREQKSHVGKIRETVTVSPELAEALTKYAASLRPEPSRTSVWVVALEDYLAGKGFWPMKR